MTVRLASLLLVILCGAGVSGCATSEKDDADRVSTIPWNRPQKWEGQGMLGGFNSSQ